MARTHGRFSGVFAHIDDAPARCSQQNKKQVWGAGVKGGMLGRMYVLYVSEEDLVVAFEAQTRRD
jgi:hypothetical protein